MVSTVPYETPSEFAGVGNACRVADCAHKRELNPSASTIESRTAPLFNHDFSLATDVGTI